MAFFGSRPSLLSIGDLRFLHVAAITAITGKAFQFIIICTRSERLICISNMSRKLAVKGPDGDTPSILAECTL